MNPKDKANFLVINYKNIITEDIVDNRIVYGLLTLKMAKKCAKLFCDELIKEFNSIEYANESEDYEFLMGYWNEVKEEIDNFKQ